MWANAIQACCNELAPGGGGAAKPIKWYEPDNKWFSLHDLQKPTATKFNHLTMQWLEETFMPWHILKTDYISYYKFQLSILKMLFVGVKVRELKSLFLRFHSRLGSVRLGGTPENAAVLQMCEKPINGIFLILHLLWFLCCFFLCRCVPFGWEKRSFHWTLCIAGCLEPILCFHPSSCVTYNL